MDGRLFRSVLARWPSGVAVVTTIGPHGPHGMTASSFSSVSLDPPLISVCVGNYLPSKEFIASSGVFAISFLSRDHAHVGKVFAGPHGDRFAAAEAAWETDHTGCAVLAGATGWLSCQVEHAYPGGDHTIFVGRVTDGGISPAAAPLLFHSRSWGHLSAPLPDIIHLSTMDDGVPAIPDAFAADRETEVLGELARLSVWSPEIVLTEQTPASPLQVRRLLQDAVPAAKPALIRVRLLAHHGLGLVNALVAMKSGVTRFDTGSTGISRNDLHMLATQLGVQCLAIHGSNTEVATGVNNEHPPSA